MTSTASKILDFAKALPEGGTITAKELLQFGSREAVDKALSRFTLHGKLPRIGTGLYVSPIYSRFGQGFPSISLVIDDITRKTGEILAPPGVVCANRLRLTNQNPVKRFYLTSGKSRQLTFKTLIVEFRNVPAWQLIEPDSMPGNVIRALDWMGKDHADEAIGRIDRILSNNDRITVLSLRNRLPTWMAEELSRLEK